jgi:AraC family transcriptional activator of pobA
MDGIKTVDKTAPEQSIKIAPFDPNKRQTKPHKHHNYLEIIVLFNSKGQHVIDNEVYKIDKPIVFTVRKEQVHFWDLAPNPEGVVIIIKNTFINQCEDPIIKNLLHQLAFHQCFVPSETESFALLADILVEAFNFSNKSIHYKEGLLKAFLSELLQTSVDYTPTHISRNSIFNQFIELIQSKSVQSITVNDYAKALHTTPQNLTQICKKQQNQTATEIINEAIINETVRLLYYSNNSISEIGTELGFKDTSHFVKFFKRYKNTTPQKFRLDS